MNNFETEIEKGERYSFGKNWRGFLATLNDDRIKEAENSLLQLLKIANLKGLKFLDAGSGSGLFSLSARRLGATVVSFDFDPESVACTSHLQSRYCPNDADWKVLRGSVLDDKFLGGLGHFDIVYSWGVLHHTGKMWMAIDNAASMVKTGGILCIAIYNHQGQRTAVWLRAKQIYCSGFLGKAAMSSIFIPYFFCRTVIGSLLKRENQFATYKKNRGMAIFHDWHDWLGGLPFEAAKVEDIFHYARKKGFVLTNLVTCDGFGCNQFVFIRSS
ncbi:MAG: class I SAM-dependent methyltransferase [Nibricoccus sp.]